jgi:hypothetical protein
VTSTSPAQAAATGAGVRPAGISGTIFPVSSTTDSIPSWTTAARCPSWEIANC